MLAAMAAFVQQSAMIVVSEAAASFGLMPQPATTLKASVHFHDNLAVNLHVHVDHSGPGHVHGPADVDHDKVDPGGKVVVCSAGHTFAVMPILACAAILDSAPTVESAPIDRLIGIEPDRLNRPPSTPSMG
jgi:hypothetical protein